MLFLTLYLIYPATIFPFHELSTMHISKLLLGLLSMTFVLAHPILESKDAGASVRNTYCVSLMLLLD